MDRDEFKKLVSAGIDAIPEKFAKRLDNVVVTVDDLPSPEQLKKGRVRPGFTLFGLYEGIPQTQRGSGYTMVLPDKITVFQQPIVSAANGDPEVIKTIVKDTVWHEIAHHFGLDEGEVRHRESKRNS